MAVSLQNWANYQPTDFSPKYLLTHVISSEWRMTDDGWKKRRSWACFPTWSRNLVTPTSKKMKTGCHWPRLMGRLFFHPIPSHPNSPKSHTSDFFMISVTSFFPEPISGRAKKNARDSRSRALCKNSTHAASISFGGLTARSTIDTRVGRDSR